MLSRLSKKLRYFWRMIPDEVGVPGGSAKYRGKSSVEEESCPGSRASLSFEKRSILLKCKDGIDRRSPRLMAPGDGRQDDSLDACCSDIARERVRNAASLPDPADAFRLDSRESRNSSKCANDDLR